MDKSLQVSIYTQKTAEDNWFLQLSTVITNFF